MISSINKVAKYLKELTDTTKFSHEQTIINLKDCLKDKKCCIFSCGVNISEHCDKFNQIKNDKTFITCCIKSAIEQLDFKTDILALYGLVNGTYLNNDNIKNVFILKTEQFKCNEQSYNLDNFKIDDFETDVYNIINFLNYVGVKEIYLFGYYLADYIINDLTNYNYYDDIVCNKFHTYDKAFSRVKEPGVIMEHIESSKIAQYCVDNDILIYNVSTEGCLSNKIKRVTFESVFTNEKTFISSNIAYKDFLDEFDDKVDIDFYYERNCNINNNNNITLFEKKDEVLHHLIQKGIYCLQKVNKHDKKNEININNFIKDIMCLFSYISSYSTVEIGVGEFWCHNLIKFNNTFNVCFYRDFDKISYPNFYDDLLLLKINDINNVNFDIFYSELNNTIYNECKYFKLLCYLIHVTKFENIPNDFNPGEYLELNKDISHFTKIGAANHYAYSGYKENRKYKFKPKITHQYKENRKYKYETQLCLNRLHC